MNPTSITWRPKPLLNYFRSRSLVNGNVNLIAPSITAQEQLWADYALPASGDAKDGYRFYVEGYLDGDKPYSYQNTSGKLDWTARSTGETEERFRLHRLEWMVSAGQGLPCIARRELCRVVGIGLREPGWRPSRFRRAITISMPIRRASPKRFVRRSMRGVRSTCRTVSRHNATCSTISCSPRRSRRSCWLHVPLPNLVEQVGHVMNHYAEDGDELAQESYACLIVPERSSPR